MIEKYPGKQDISELWAVNHNRIARYIDNHVIPFLDLPQNPRCLDVGEANPRMEYLKEEMGIDVDQWDTDDLNFDSIDKVDYYNAVFFFDTAEHLQNLLWTMRELKKAVKPDGSIYVNVPENPQWLWGAEHYFELGRTHFEKWIVNPLGLRIAREKRIFFIANWKAYFIGFRPLWRIIKGESTWRAMARSMFCVKYRIYELRKD